jgi:hypothetical protein
MSDPRTTNQGADQMATPMIDIENLTSKAITELTCFGDGLAEERDAFAARAREQAEKLTKQQLAEEIAKVNESHKVKLSEPHAALVDVAVAEFTKHSEPGRELARLTQNAEADRRMAKALNVLIERAERDLAKLTPKRRDDKKPDLFDHAWALQSYVDSFLIAADTARWAVKVARAVENGHDIREVSINLAKGALREAPSVLKRIVADGLSGAGRARELYEGLAAEAFARAVGQTYGLYTDEDDLMVNLAELTF